MKRGWRKAGDEEVSEESEGKLVREVEKVVRVIVNERNLLEMSLNRGGEVGERSAS